MKKNKIGMIIVGIMVVCLLTLGVVGIVLHQKAKEEEKIKKQFIRTKDEFTINLCNGENCSMYDTLVFPQIETDIDDQELQKKIDEVNRKSEKYYQDVQNSEQEKSSCTNLPENYRFPLRIQFSVNAEKKGTVVNVSTYVEGYNYCTKEIVPTEMTSYFYDLKKKKEMSMEEFMKMENLTYDILENSIATAFRKSYTNDNVEDVVQDMKKQNRYVIQIQNGTMIINSYSTILNGWFSITEKELLRSDNK